MNPGFSSADIRILRDALCAIPQFRTVRERQTFIRSAFDDHLFSKDVESVLQYLDWEGAPLVVADALLRLVEGHEIAPGVPALRVLAEAIEPMAGMARREQVRNLRERLGWVDPPRKPAFAPVAGAVATPEPAAIAAKRERGEYDVFLCHNSKDKAAVMHIADLLLQRGLLPWLDQDCLRPGFRWMPEIERQIQSIPAAAVFVGPSGIGPWQDEEIDAILRRFKQHNRPVIPVLLEGAPEIELPAFLEARTRVDFRKNSRDPMDHLEFGITGRNPRFASSAS
ncbi:MAG: TIR domain-containing protein [Bryobacteraceae bacterium]|nr:TIR domain-containing protein [Bryobacteraceae bacterium]